MITYIATSPESSDFNYVTDEIIEKFRECELSIAKLVYKGKYYWDIEYSGDENAVFLKLKRLPELLKGNLSIIIKDEDLENDILDAMEFDKYNKTIYPIVVEEGPASLILFEMKE